MNTAATFSDEDPTLVVEVPAIRHSAQPKDGYAYLAMAPRDTDINTIPNDAWDTDSIRVLEDETFILVGQRTIDDTVCNVWWVEQGDAFLAQSVIGA